MARRCALEPRLSLFLGKGGGAVRREPGAMHTPCKAPAPIGDRGDQRRSGEGSGSGPHPDCQHFGWKRRALITPPWGQAPGAEVRCRQACLRPAPRLRNRPRRRRWRAAGGPWDSLAPAHPGRPVADGRDAPGASARRSGKRGRLPVLSRMMSRRSPCSPVAPSGKTCRPQPGPDAGPVRRTKSDRPGVILADRPRSNMPPPAVRREGKRDTRLLRFFRTERGSHLRSRNTWLNTLRVHVVP